MSTATRGAISAARFLCGERKAVFVNGHGWLDIYETAELIDRCTAAPEMLKALELVQVKLAGYPTPPIALLEALMPPVSAAIQKVKEAQ